MTAMDSTEQRYGVRDRVRYPARNLPRIQEQR
jgi:hypothetical protein